MFKIAKSSLEEVKAIMRQNYEECPRHWPFGVSAAHFDGGVWAVKEAQTGKVAGWVGWQERYEHDPNYPLGFAKIGYYSVGILPEHRRNGFAKAALEKLIAAKSAGVDRVRALIVSTNEPSQELARALGVETRIKSAAFYSVGLLKPSSFLRYNLMTA